MLILVAPCWRLGSTLLSQSVAVYYCPAATREPRTAVSNLLGTAGVTLVKVACSSACAPEHRHLVASYAAFQPALCTLKESATNNVQTSSWLILQRSVHRFGERLTRLYMSRGRGIVLDEPSVVAIRRQGATKSVAAVGAEAKPYAWQKRQAISLQSAPLKDGVIADFQVTEKMLQHFIHKVHENSFITPSPPRACVYS